MVARRQVPLVAGMQGLRHLLVAGIAAIQGAVRPLQAPRMEIHAIILIRIITITTGSGCLAFGLQSVNAPLVRNGVPIKASVLRRKRRVDGVGNEILVVGRLSAKQLLRGSTPSYAS